ncbi:ATP synthase F0 subunit A [Candidatus Giovannonibacteria bacterium RIFCSPLOWO2_02_FULL_45_14]|uniref:ATP synthase subunit a n=1 Tax=Candidatus Giovannonibacteria bacterium RIFCSPLOWO2_12_FULL_44_15 TaxID=1798364 RepID=A0A1F5XZZ8_9BACT|nr:MAG: ATP synthase F0 subunit A [Candidatus Giovannonibacteria bacterium RIFCSPHIGHO2_02_FULL_44_31]OGF75903.1 MAG: ATP synthase F0 subunit A [Candidatus Giovannonibacteria bacterium RIFCSPHIGHO2_12_FULL_44_29]OGF91187.1 MAG: ATP synthase F0 subunit A [Candidatus Giovannonibacteria bacterium RIFCSPLOWO2_02_FULL_45_14]OGF93517.1 MAG: ATP synthase F0 subunit A [Candidatus Giovannonibacteria bacterium RIFCSPLOWO2_12_FULL_44_15]
MHEISIKAEKLFDFLGIPVTNALFLSTVVMLILVSFAFYSRRKNMLAPGRVQNFIEFLLEKLLNLMDSVLGSRETSERYLPLIATVFIFIVVSNWFGLLPVVGSIGVGEGEHFIPLFRSPAADLNFTLALATISVFGVNLLGALALGAKKHFSKFFTIKNPIFSFVGILEFISEFIKIISFSFRLFGNVFAGEVLLMIVGFLIPYFVPLPFLFLELFVGFIQAFIFSMLTLVFVAIAVKEEAH